VMSRPPESRQNLAPCDQPSKAPASTAGSPLKYRQSSPVAPRRRYLAGTRAPNHRSSAGDENLTSVTWLTRSRSVGRIFEQPPSSGCGLRVCALWRAP
jgi:hypothetical protein